MIDNKNGCNTSICPWIHIEVMVHIDIWYDRSTRYQLTPKTSIYNYPERMMPLRDPFYMAPLQANENNKYWVVPPCCHICCINQRFPVFPPYYSLNTCRENLKLKTNESDEKCYIAKLSENAFDPMNNGNIWNGSKGK